jgi:hypothetical protein
MLFPKAFTNYLKCSKHEYNRLMKRRGERLLLFIDYDVPKIIITNEIELLRESFLKFIIKKYIKKIQTILY